MIRGDKAASILIIAVLVAAAVRLSDPGFLPFPRIVAFLALSAALGLLFLQVFEGPLARVSAAVGLALFALHPFTVAALKNSDDSLVASLAGMAAGLTILRWRPERRWHQWVSLIPAALCIVQHRVGIVFAPLALVLVPGSWPGAVISAIAVILQLGGHHDGFSLVAVPQATMGALAGFFLPFSSQGANWNILEGLIALAAVIGACIYNAVSFRLPALTFGLAWFLAMIVAAPNEPMAALPGLALAFTAVLEGVAAHYLPLCEDLLPGSGTGKRLLWCVLAAVLLGGALLRATHIHDPHRLTPNERAYLYYAGRIHDEGLGAARAIHAEYVDNPDMWELAPPVRIGYLMVLETAMSVMGTKDLEAGMAVSFLASVLTLPIVAWMGMRFFNPWVALIASALCGTSFTEIWLVRGTPQDGVFGLLGLAAVWLTCEIMRAPRRLWLWIPYHLVGIEAVLVKQSGVFVYGFTALWLIAFLLFHERAVRQAAVLAASVAAGLLVACGILILLAGNAHSAWRAYQLGFLCNDEAWAYQEDCCFGPWTQLPIALFLLSPVTFVLSVVGMGVVALPQAWGSTLTVLQRYYGAVCAFMAVGFVFLFSFYPKMQILRYITPGDGAVCLVAALGLWFLLSQAQRRLPRLDYAALVAIAVLGVAEGLVRDYGIFNRVAMQADIPELGAALIRDSAVSPVTR